MLKFLLQFINAYTARTAVLRERIKLDREWLQYLHAKLKRDVDYLALQERKHQYYSRGKS